MPDGEQQEGQVAEQASEGSAPAPATTKTIEVPPDLDVDELLAQGALEEAAAEAAADEPSGDEEAPAGDDEPEPEGDDAEGDDESDTDDDEGEQEEADEADAEADEDADEEDDEEDEEPAEPTAAEASFDRLLAEDKPGQALFFAPQRWSNILTSRRGEAIKESQDIAYRAGAQEASRLLGERQKMDEQLREFVAEKAKLREDDESGFVAWQTEEPDEAARYFEGVRYFTDIREGKPARPPAQAASAQGADDQPSVQARATAQMTTLATLPQSVADPLRGRINAGEFPLTEAGLGALTEAIKRASQEAPTGNQNGKTAKRKGAARRRAKTARPDTGTGTASEKANPLDDINDVDELLSMAAESTVRAGR